MADSRQQNCDSYLLKSFRKTAAADSSIPGNPTIIVNDTDPRDMSKEVRASRKQGNASGPGSFSRSSSCEPENGTHQDNLDQPTSSRSSVDSGVGGLSRNNSSGSVKKTSIEGLLDKPDFEPITEQSQDEESCSILPESLDNIQMLKDLKISSTTPEFDTLAEHTEIMLPERLDNISKLEDATINSTTPKFDGLVERTETLGESRGVENDEKGDLSTGELRRLSQDKDAAAVTSTTEDDEGSWVAHTERKSISIEAIDNLIQAVQVICNETQHPSPHVTEIDGPFRTYPVRRHSTADPSIPLTQHSKLSERTRKRSVQPFFHHLVSKDDESYKKRKKSACIMCERNRITETAESATSVFIRKAVTPLDCQKGRRYSEVLKTYKPSEIPFTEVRVFKVEQWRQNETHCHRVGHRKESKQPVASLLDESQSRSDAITDMQLQEILERNMPMFLQCTNWSGIFAHLVSKRLLDNECREILLCTYRTDTYKGNYFYGHVLPAMGRESRAYVKLYQCLEETKDEHPGHNTLFGMLCDDLKTYYYDKYCQATNQ